jgi:hypothetical protein
VAGDRLHVVAADLVAQDVRHVSFDGDGASGPGVALPLAYPTGLAACDGALIVAGASATDEHPVAFYLDLEGVPTTSFDLPINGSLVRGPAPVCLRDGPAVTWETYDGQGTMATVRRLADGAETASLPFPTFTDDAAVAVTGGRLVLVRVDPTTLELTLLVLDDAARVMATATLAEGVTSVAAVSSGDGMAVAWVDNANRLVAQQLTADLDPGPEVVVATVVPPTEIVAPRLAATEGAVAVLHIEQTTGDPLPLTDEAWPVLSHPPRSTTEVVTIVLSAGETAESALLEPPSAGSGAAGWLGSTLLVVHGAGTPLVSVFETG